MVSKSARRLGLCSISVLALALLVLGLGAVAPARADLGAGSLLIAGTRLTVSPESQTVPFDTPTIVETTLQGFDPERGTLPADLRVLGDLVGPEIPERLTLETRPGEPFRIPRLSLQGEYVLEDIRLVSRSAQGAAGDRLLAYAAPRSAVIRVTQILITKVTSRALTLPEIRSRGIVISGDNFKAFDFTFGFTVEGRTINYDVPVIWRPHGEPPEILVGIESGSAPARFQPPQLAPFVLDLKPENDDPMPQGGCLDPSGDCSIPDPPPVPGVILFPTDSSLLHQFFSVVLMVQNGAPAGDRLVVRDLTAKIQLPAALRAAETEPPTPLGAPVPVHVPGPDGELGTADDVTFLIAQAMGEAEFLVEGLREGTHVVSIELDGVLEGLPTGIRRVGGTARGAVIVRDPRFAIHISHPDVVRRNEQYSLRLNVSNVSNVPANLLSIGLPASALVGVELVDPSQFRKTIETLLPGESQSVEFRLRALRTGRVTAAAARTDDTVTPTFDLRTGVGETGIPLSPNSIVLSRSAESLPPSLVEAALDLAGLGLSLAEAPAASLNPNLPQVSQAIVDQRVWQLAQAGRHKRLGEELFDSTAVLAAEWLGARDGDWDWDELRRTTQTGRRFTNALGALFQSEIAAQGADAAFERYAATTAFLPPLGGVLATGSHLLLDLSSRTSGRHLTTGVSGQQDVRDLPFADLLPITNGEWALLGSPEAGGYRATVRATQATVADLQILITTDGPKLRVLRFRDVALGANGTATIEWNSETSSAFLSIDSDGDGNEDASVPASVEVVPPRPFQMVSAVQNSLVDPTGHVVDVLFSGDVDLGSLYPSDPNHFSIPGKLSNGGALPSEQNVYLRPPVLGGEPVQRNPFEGLRDTRVVQVIFNNPLSPYVDQPLTAGSVESVLGELASTATRNVVITVTTPGGIVEGKVIGSDGQPLAFAEVTLKESDLDVLTGDCEQHTTAGVRTDARGNFLFDYVRQTECGAPFVLTARDPGSEKRGMAAGRIRFVGSRVKLDIVLLGRGKVQGRALYDDGTVPTGLSIVGYSAVFKEGRSARIDALGNYDIGDLPVGTISLSATAGDGSFALATIALPSSGATVTRDLVLLRRPDAATGTLRGTVFETDGTTPVVQAFVALYVNGQFIAVRRSDFDGRFDFGEVPAGTAEIEAFSAETGRAGARIFVEIEPDRVNDLRVLLVDERGVVEGHVYRRTLAGVVPVAGAVVYAFQTPFHTVTDALGAYRLENVFAGTLSVHAADLAAGREVMGTVTVRDGAVANLDLFFEENTLGSIAGVIRDASGAPLAGATIHLGTGDRWSRETFADASGAFTFDGVAPGNWDVHGFKNNDGAKVRVAVRFAGDSAFADLRVIHGSIRGRVLAQNGSNTIGVRAIVRYRTTTVRLGLVGLDLASHDLETNADGTWEIPNVLGGDYNLTITNAFYGARSFSGVIATEGQVSTHDVLFEENGKITGTVLDQDGVTPAANALVRLVHPNFFSQGPSGYEVRTNAEGRFTADLIPPTPNPFPIDVEWDNGIVYRKGRVWVRFDQFGQQLDVPITLLKQAPVRGRVEDANGVPVPRADVTLRGVQYPNQTLRQQSDDDGGFSFTNVLEGPLSITATAPGLGGLSGKTQVEVIQEGTAVEGVVVRLEPTAEIRGRLLSPIDGTAVSGASVILVRFGKLLDSANSDDEGRFSFRLLPLAPYQVEAFDPRTGRQGKRSNLQLTNNGQVLEFDLTLEARGEVAGTFQDPAGNVPIAGAPIRLFSAGIHSLTTFASTDLAGEFEFLGVPQGSFTLEGKSLDGRRKAMNTGAITTEGERVIRDLVLEPLGVTYGSVTRPLGQPTGLFTPSNVVLIQDGLIVSGTLENPFRFDQVIVGRPFTLMATEPGGDHIGRVSGLVSSATQEVRADIPMQSVGTLEVEVVDGSGVPASGVELYGQSTVVVLSGPQSFGTQSYFGTTNAQGLATFPSIRQGAFSITARDPVRLLGGSVNGQLTQDGVVTRVRLTLQSSGTVRGIVVNSDGVTPSAGALLVLKTSSGNTLRQSAAADGSFTFPAPIGIFTIDITQNQGPGRRFHFGRIDTNGQVFDFGTLVLDDASPTLVAVEPTNGSMGVPIAPAIRVRFSEPVQSIELHEQMLSLQLLRSDGSTERGISKVTTFADGGATLVLNLSAPLESFRRYRVTVNDSKIIDPAGRGLLGGRVETTFTTADVIPPSVTAVSPAAGAIQVATNTFVRITFSEPLDAFGLDGSAFQLFDQTAGVGVATGFAVATNAREVTLTPFAPLAEDHTFQVHVVGVRDTSGNVMPTFTSLFSTIDSTPPVVTLAVPATITRDVPALLVATPVASPDIASVRFYREGVLLGTTTAPTFSWSYTPNAADAAAGSVTFGAEAVDRGGNVGPISLASAVVDPNAPPVIVLSTNPATEIDPARRLDITGTVSDSDGVASWTLLVTGAVTQTFESGPLSGTSFNLVQSVVLPVLPPSNTVEVRVRAIDALGKEITSAPRIVAVKPDTTPPFLQIVTPQEGDALPQGTQVSVEATASDSIRLESVTLEIAGSPDDVRPFNPLDSTYRFTFTAPSVTESTPFSLAVVARDVWGNVTRKTLALTVTPQESQGPRIELLCPEVSDLGPIYAVAGQPLRFTIDAVDPSGVAQVETLGPLGSRIDTTAPYEFNLTVPTSIAETLLQTIRATDALGNVASVQVFVSVLQNPTLLTTNTTLGGERPNPYLEATALVIPNGKTLTIDGSVELPSLYVMNGGRVEFAAATATETPDSKLFLFSTNAALRPALYVSCSGVVDASGKGFLGGGAASQSSGGAPGRGVDNDPTEGAPAGTGGSHGGRGGAAVLNTDPLLGAAFDSPFWPTTPGGGGGGAESAGSAGGGSIEIYGGDIVIDGSVLSNGASGAGPTGAGGSILIAPSDFPEFDALDTANFPVVRGAGRIEASGGASTSAGPTGSGGRIALWARTTPSLETRVVAAGGSTTSTSTSMVGGAGTIYLHGGGAFQKPQDDPLPFVPYSETLIVDNAGQLTANVTVLPSVGSGTVTAFDAENVLLTDAAADFESNLRGSRIRFSPQPKLAFRLDDHAHHTDTLVPLRLYDDDGNLLVAIAPGVTYEGYVGFDVVRVRGGAKLAVASEVGTPCEILERDVDATSELLSECTPPLAIETPKLNQRVESASALTVRLDVRADQEIVSATLLLGGVETVDDQAPFEWQVTAPVGFESLPYVLEVDAVDGLGDHHRLHTTIVVEPSATGSSESNAVATSINAAGKKR